MEKGGDEAGLAGGKSLLLCSSRVTSTLLPQSSIYKKNRSAPINLYGMPRTWAGHAIGEDQSP
jgi:hypothetical protein